MKKITLVIFGLSIIFISFGGVCSATYISGSGTNSEGDPVSFTGDLAFSGWEEGDSGYSGILSISLTNPIENESGALTSLAFLLPSGVTATEDSLEGWTFLEGPFSAPPIGDYSTGASSKTGGNVNWQGGNTHTGIALNNSKTFDFGINSQTEIANFTDILANQENFIAVRFQGFANEASAKLTGGGGGGAQVPEPATIFLLGSGLLGLLGYRKKFWKPKN
jgi:hypothetical protein